MKLEQLQWRKVCALTYELSPRTSSKVFEGTQKDAATATMAYFWSLSSVYNLVYDNRKCLSTSQSNSGTKDMCVVNWKVSSVALSLHPQKNETAALILAYVKSDARFPMFWRCVFHDLTKCYQHTQFTQSKENTVSLEHKSDHKICVKALTSQSGKRKHPCILSMGKTILTSRLWVWAKDWTRAQLCK